MESAVVRKTTVRRDYLRERAALLILKGEPKCQRCEILLIFAKEGRSDHYCGECLNELGII